MAEKSVYIISACRTGMGSFKGQFSNIPATTLGSELIKFSLQRIHLAAKEISEVIIGQVLTAGCGPNPGCQAAIGAGIPQNVPAFTINMLSGSGLKAVCLGYETVRNGNAKFLICGGQENMTMAQHSIYLREGEATELLMADTIHVDGLIDPFTGFYMGEAAECLARTYNISREAQDNLAYVSHMKASKAVEESYFIYEIAPVFDIKKDETVQHNVTLEKLSQIPPLCEDTSYKQLTITTGNSSDYGDGAAILILSTKEELLQRDFIPLAKIVTFGLVGVHPTDSTLATIEAINNVLQLADWTKDSVDLFEINETTAAETLIVIEQLGLVGKKVNISGGSIAFGNPLAVSGARMLVTLIYNLNRLKLERGIVALCIDGGMGLAIAIERPESNLVI